MSLLVSGATSLLGSYVLNEFLKREEKIYLLCRQKSLSNLTDDVKNHPQIEIVLGDIAQPQVLMDDAAIKKLAEVTDFVHMATSYGLSDDLPRAYLNNVVGTQNILDLASQLPELKRLHAISTLAIAGSFEGRFMETMFNVGQKFSNPFAFTKFRGEGLLGSWNRDDVKRIVYRLGILVGDSQSGFINRFEGPYIFYRSLLEHRKFWQFVSALGRTPIPYDPEAQLPFLPVDVAGKFLGHMISHPSPVKGRLRSYHLVGTHVPVEQLLNRGLEAFGYKSRAFPMPRPLISNFFLKQGNLPTEFLDYLHQKIEFDDAHLRHDYPDLQAPNFDAFSGPLFSFMKEPT